MTRWRKLVWNIHKAAFAYFLLTTSAHRHDSLLRHEAWNYLLGVMSKILDRQLPEEEEPLALLVSPNICFALRSIPNGITSNVMEYLRMVPRWLRLGKCLLASPWALTMRLSMQELLDNETQNESYFKQLQERIRSEGLKLVNEVSSLWTYSAPMWRKEAIRCKYIKGRWSASSGMCLLEKKTFWLNAIL